VLVTRDPTNKDLKSTDWLIRRNAIAILPSVYSLKVLRGKNSKVAVAKPLIGFGDPVFQRGGTAIGVRIASNRGYASFYRAGTADLEVLAKALPPLPETADELRAVAKSLGAGEADLKLGSAATVTAVKQTKLDQYRIVYFATHALVSGETEQAAKGLLEPALVLSLPVTATAFDDGLLTSSDVAQLKLNAAAPPLVVAAEAASVPSTASERSFHVPLHPLPSPSDSELSAPMMSGYRVLLGLKMAPATAA
jgi:hypothetical protein